ncbi:TetR/AcrR family transcriptional regulator [Sphingomonas sp. LH128]|uniref:TetR/AcrR family transcriptional regulator n=1 Tax=Sphingomonas sp. LH128 TaxID=473781 RepID=UPI000309E9DC|nr:TetR/AcrR family transcriptional regulator [Sphingomonas sp. LH128]
MNYAEHASFDMMGYLIAIDTIGKTIVWSEIGMKDWASDHPKAKLMARKREVILSAAKEAFLSHGYSGASMEGIAAAAGVSIMTLYRHAENKDDLFAAVIESACHPADREEEAALAASLKKSLRDILVFVGVMFQERLAGEDTVTLFRAVMVETKRFPQLARMAFDGLIGSHQAALDAFLAGRTEADGLKETERRMLGAEFLDRLVGLDIYKVMLGLNGPSSEERRVRAQRAADALLDSLTMET